MHWVVALGTAMAFAWLLTRAAIWVLQRQRHCPACESPLEVLSTSTPEHTYEVLACSGCSTSLTLAQGQRQRFAWCPACRQRSLHIPSLRLPAPPQRARIEVRERCELCSYTSTRLVEGALRSAPEAGKVVPFPERD